MIELLKFPENVRRRHSVFFGDSEYSEIEVAFLQLLCLFSEEAADGHSSEINVRLNGDESLELYSVNRGLFLGADTESEEEWVSIFCELFGDSCDLRAVKSRFAPDDEYIGMNSHHFSRDEFLLCINQCVSEYMEVISVRDGTESRLRFEKGKNVGGLIKMRSASPSSTCIRIKYDKEVFGKVHITTAFLKEELKRLSILNAGVRFNLFYENGDVLVENTFFYRDGIKDYIKEITGNREMFDGSCTCIGKDEENSEEYTARLRILFTSGNGCTSINTFHNYRLLSLNGEHTEKAVELIKKKNPELSNNLMLWVISNTSRGYSRWNDGGQRSLKNEMLTQMVEKIIESE